MTTKLNLIFASILIIAMVIYKIYIIVKTKHISNEFLYYKNKKMIIILTIFTIISFILSLIINIQEYKDNLNLNSSITCIINAISIAILSFPYSLLNIYYNYFPKDENIYYVKTLITNITDPKMIKKINKAKINVILLNKEDTTLKFKIIQEKEIIKKIPTKNVQIKTDNYKILDKYKKNKMIYYEFEDLQKFYDKLYESRGRKDNYTRCIKYLISSYLPLIISYYFLTLIKAPITYNILLVVFLKIYTELNSNYLYKKMPYDIDIMTRKPNPLNTFIGSQETIFLIINCLCIFFALNIPYMFVFVENGSSIFANTLFYIIFIYSNIFITLSYFSESNILKNIFKSFKSIRFIIYLLLSITITIIINKTSYFNTTNIGIHNYISCVLFSLLAIVMNELTKFARLMTQKGRRK